MTNAAKIPSAVMPTFAAAIQNAAWARPLLPGEDSPRSMADSSERAMNKAGRLAKTPHTTQEAIARPIAHWALELSDWGAYIGPIADPCASGAA